MGKEGTVKLTVEVPEELHEMLVEMAEGEGDTDVEELVIEGIEMVLREGGVLEADEVDDKEETPAK